MTKRSMSPSRRKRILERYGHACRQCGEKDGRLEIDHMHEIWLGGPDDDDNLQTLCLACHAIRTKDGAGRRAKVKRLRGETCTGPRQKIPSRPFPKTQRKLPSRSLREARM